MATITNFVGFETGGLDEADQTSGSPDATEATIVRNGARSLAMNAIGDRYDILGIGTDANGIIGFGLYITDKTPAAATEFMQWRDGAAGEEPVILTLQTNGDLLIDYVTDGTSDTVSDPFTEGQWHYIEVYAFANSSTGVVTVDIDGSQVSSTSSLDTVGLASTIRIILWGTASGTLYFDDFYCATGATDSGDFLGPNVNIPAIYQNDVEDGTDVGDALDQGTWSLAGDFPGSDEAAGTAAAYTTSAVLEGHTITDDADSNSRPGPSGGPAIGTVLAAKFVGRHFRGNGGGTTHNMVYGHNGNTTTTSLTLGGSPSTTFVTLEASDGLVPTTSEYFALGIGRGTGGRELYLTEQSGILLTLDADGERRIFITHV
jgi:hypothetical protein